LHCLRATPSSRLRRSIGCRFLVTHSLQQGVGDTLFGVIWTEPPARFSSPATDGLTTIHCFLRGVGAERRPHTGVIGAEPHVRSPAPALISPFHC